MVAATIATTLGLKVEQHDDGRPGFHDLNIITADGSPATAEVPDLPDQVMQFWLMAFWTVGSGLCWSPERGWERFERQLRIGT